MTEKLCLKWNDFQENMNIAFGSLREDKEFADVTLACEDGQKVEAHKVILVASSPFFQKILTRNKHPHPLIFMKGSKFEDLMAIVDFLYCGEANVFQENLDSFLAIAEEMKLKGLTGQQEMSKENIKPMPSTMITRPSLKSEESNLNTGQRNYVSKTAHAFSELNEDRTISAQDFVAGDLQELDEKVKSMMENSPNLTPNGREKAKMCKVCGKEGYNVGIRDHIEANHLQGVALPCNICEKTFRSRQRFRKHKCL